VPDGIYAATERFVRRISANVPPRADVEKLIAILSSARGEDPVAARAAIEEEAPSLTPYLTDFLGLTPAQWGDGVYRVLFVLGWVLALLDVVGRVSPANTATLVAMTATAVREFRSSNRRTTDLQEMVRLGARAALEEREEEKRRERNRRKRDRRARRRT
jgi:hypothetical protein